LPSGAEQVDWSAVRFLLIDMDGVLFRGSRRLEGADGLLPWLERGGIEYRLLTNNSTASPERNAEMLAAMGIRAPVGSIFTSSLATAMDLTESGTRGPVYVIGEAGLHQALTEAGMEISTAAEGVTAVVAGLDRGVTYDRLRTACLALESGAEFVATNADTSLPVEEGLAPGAGALQAAITATTGIRPRVIGKPQPRMLELAMAAMGAEVEQTAMLGDRLDTDIAAAAALDMTALLVLTGVSTRVDIAGSPAKPTAVFEDLPELMRAWEAALR